MKYVILKSEHQDMGYDRVYPVLFPEYMVHAYVAAVLKTAVEQDIKKSALIYSGGFCWLHNGRWVAEHRSESLGMIKNEQYDSRDARILNMPHALQGMVIC